MLLIRSTICTLVAALMGCAGDAETAPPPPVDPASSEILVAAVEAGTSAPLSDPELTVRYLVRAPITLDAAAVERVPAGEPYRIVHAVSEDSLIVEVRLEAPSYVRTDTVLTVARGGRAGPIRVAMQPRTAVARTGAAAPAARTPSPAALPQAAPAAPVAGAGVDDVADAAADRRGLRDGDAAFERADWRAAVSAYRRMPPPRGRGPYAREYLLGLVRLGISQINLGQFPAADEALSEAVELDPREYTAHFYLGQAQCALGRFDEGRRTLGEVDRLASTVSAAQRPIVLALNDYQRAVCSHGEYLRARTEPEARVAAARALGELDEFISRGGAMSPVPAPIQQAIADAERRALEIAGR